MSSKYEKIQIYMAASQEEYDKAIAWVRKKKYGNTIKEVGHMDSTDWLGNHLDVYVFLYTAPDRSMVSLGKYMNVFVRHI